MPATTTVGETTDIERTLAYAPFWTALTRIWLPNVQK